jgi:hypothetical protein
VRLFETREGGKMYLHAGNGKNIREKNIIGIFDMDNATVSSITRKYLTSEQKKNRVYSVSNDIPKSFIVCRDKNGKERVYISQISSSTLLKRTGYVDSLTNV